MPKRNSTPEVDYRDKLLKPTEVAAKFRVDPKTVARWAAKGLITSIRTPGGHRRYREHEVYALLNGAIVNENDHSKDSET